MSTAFPKLPGYSVYHDPSKVDFKKISHHILANKINGEVKIKALFPLPRQRLSIEAPSRSGKSLSSSQEILVNHFISTSTKERFQPLYVKYDKQVLRFYCTYNESIVESSVENARIRKLTLLYFLEDNTIELVESKETNSGISGGAFLKRGKVVK